MTFAQSLVLFSACLAAMASPGPGVAALVARASAVGLWGAVPFIAGMVVGDLMLFSAAIIGMASFGAALSPFLIPLSAVAGLWLIWLGVRQWRDAGTAITAQAAGGSFLAAWLLTLGNPKTIIFYLALLPLIIGPQGLRPTDAIFAGAIVALTLSMVMLGYGALTQAAMGFLRHPGPLRRGCGALMAVIGMVLVAQAGWSLY